jgi:3-oxoacyl-[acyl-carrier-protein] synthase III
MNYTITQFKNGAEFQFEPSMSNYIKNELGASAALNFDISNACAGILYAIQVADSMLRTGKIRNALIVSNDVHPSTRHIPDFPFTQVGSAVLLEQSYKTKALQNSCSTPQTPRIPVSTAIWIFFRQASATTYSVNIRD